MLLLFLIFILVMRPAINGPLRWLSTRAQIPPTTTKEFVRHVDHYSRFNPSPLSIKQFLEFGMLSTNVYDHKICT